MPPPKFEILQTIPEIPILTTFFFYVGIKARPPFWQFVTQLPNTEFYYQVVIDSKFRFTCGEANLH